MAKKTEPKAEKSKAEKSVKPIKSEFGKSAKPSIAQQGHTVIIEYVGTLDNGDVFDDSKQHGPISFIIGSGQVIKGFNDAVIGMKVKDKKKIHITKNDAYGDLNPALVHKIPLAKLAPELKEKVKVGGFLIMQAPTGQHIPAKVQSLDKENIVLDLNHPLAGKDLNFEITLLDINTDAPSHEHSHKHSHDGKCEDGDCDCEDEDRECKDENCDCKDSKVKK